MLGQYIFQCVLLHNIYCIYSDAMILLLFCGAVIIFIQTSYLLHGAGYSLKS